MFTTYRLWSSHSWEVLVRKLWPIALLLLSACASLNQTPLSVPPDKAHVYIYRRAVPFGPAEMQIYDGQKDLGILTSGSYMDFMADPGTRVFKALAPGSGNMPYATTLAGGRTYYFLAYFLGEQSIGNAALTPMDSTTATAQMKDLKPATKP
jgi:hypothetical protein